MAARKLTILWTNNRFEGNPEDPDSRTVPSLLHGSEGFTLIDEWALFSTVFGDETSRKMLETQPSDPADPLRLLGTVPVRPIEATQIEDIIDPAFMLLPMRHSKMQLEVCRLGDMVEARNLLVNNIPEGARKLRAASKRIERMLTLMHENCRLYPNFLDNIVLLMWE